MRINHIINWVDWEKGWRKDMAGLVLRGLREAECSMEDSGTMIWQVAYLTDCPDESVPARFDESVRGTVDSSVYLETTRKLPFLFSVMEAAQTCLAEDPDWVVFSNADAILSPDFYESVWEASRRGCTTILHRAGRVHPTEVAASGNGVDKSYRRLPALPRRVGTEGLEAFAVQPGEWNRVRDLVGNYLLGECRWDDRVCRVFTRECDCYIEDKPVLYHIEHPDSWSGRSPCGRYNTKLKNTQTPVV